MALVDCTDDVLRVTYHFVLEPRRCVKHNVAYQYSQQIRDIDQMLVQCWPTICDAGSASYQHWLNASCLLCYVKLHADLIVLPAVDTDPMSVKYCDSVAGAGQYPFSPGQYFMLALPARCFEP